MEFAGAAELKRLGPRDPAVAGPGVRIDAGTVNGRPTTIIILPAGTATGHILSLHTTNGDVTAAPA
jgi:hypothetical protein